VGHKICKVRGSECIKLLVGTKIDKCGTVQRQVSLREAIVKAHAIGAHDYMEVSAKSGQNVQELFEHVARAVALQAPSPLAEMMFELQIRDGVGLCIAAAKMLWLCGAGRAGMVADSRGFLLLARLDSATHHLPQLCVRILHEAFLTDALTQLEHLSSGVTYIHQLVFSRLGKIHCVADWVGSPCQAILGELDRLGCLSTHYRDETK
jgi:hypothetical protein